MGKVEEMKELAKEVIVLVRKKFFGIEVRLSNVENELIVFNYEVPRLQIENYCKFSIKEVLIKDKTLVNFIYDSLLKHIFNDIILYFMYEGDEENE